MKNPKCLDCRYQKRCQENASSWIFFLIGLLATLAVRAVTILTTLNPFHGKVAWYVGVTGFFLFFLYKFNLSRQRTRLIEERELVEKLALKKELSVDDYEIMGLILCSLSSKKELINYFFIFGVSALALILAIYLDFLR